MFHYGEYNNRIYIQQTTKKRNLNPEDISVPQGYRVDVYLEEINAPLGIHFTDNGDLLIADSGFGTGEPKILRYSNGSLTTVAEGGFNVPITGVNSKNGDIYVSHRGVVSVIEANGKRKDIISGLPSFGDFANNGIEFGPDNKIYYGQGTATNSAVVGLDNEWLTLRPYFHDYPGENIILRGLNFETKNPLIPADERAFTGAFLPFGVMSKQQYQIIEGQVKASGSIMRANMDGSNLEMVAWGLRNPFRIKFVDESRAYITNWGLDNRGSRPIANGLDEFQLLVEGAWYGWPDYSGGEPISLPRFTPLDGKQPELLLDSIPSIPPKPVAVFPVGSNLAGFDINNNKNFGPVGNIYIANFGRILYEKFDEPIYPVVGHRIIRLNPATGDSSIFAINKVGFPQESGLGRPSDVVFGPDGAMYVSDLAVGYREKVGVYEPYTGVIWRFSKV